MPKSKIPSPARSQGVITPRRSTPRGSRSVGSPARSTASGRLTSIIDQFQDKNLDSFALSPLTGRKSVLTDNTDIEEPRRKSWWKNLNDNSRDVLEVLSQEVPVLEANNMIEELMDVEVLSQEKKNFTLDLPESSDNESINSIVLPQRKLFTQKENQAQKNFGQLIGSRETLAKLHKTNTTNHEKTITAGTRELFQGAKRSKPIFPAALLNITPNKTVGDKTKENIEPKPQVRTIFGNKPTNKRKNIFTDFIASESEDEISEIQPKIFGFQKKIEQRRVSSVSKGKDASPTSSMTTDIETDFMKYLPSSTMMENQIEQMLPGQTPVKRARLSKLSEGKESEVISTVNITKQSNKSTSKNKSKSSPTNDSRVTRSQLKNVSKIDEDITNTSKKQSKSNKSQSKTSKQLNISSGNQVEVDEQNVTIVNRSEIANKNKTKTNLNENNKDNDEIHTKNQSKILNNTKLRTSDKNKSKQSDQNLQNDLDNDYGKQVDENDDENNFTLEYEGDDNEVVDELEAQLDSIVNPQEKVPFKNISVTTRSMLAHCINDPKKSSNTKLQLNVTVSEKEENRDYGQAELETVENGRNNIKDDLVDKVDGNQRREGNEKHINQNIENKEVEHNKKEENNSNRNESTKREHKLVSNQSQEVQNKPAHENYDDDEHKDANVSQEVENVGKVNNSRVVEDNEEGNQVSQKVDDNEENGSQEVKDNDEANVSQEVEDDDEANVSQEVEDDDEANVSQEVEDDDEANVSQEVEYDDEANVNQEVEDDDEANVSQEVEDDDEANVSQEVEDDDEANVSQEVEENDEANVSQEVEDDDEANVSQEVEDDDEANVSQEVEDNDEANVSQEVEDDEQANESKEDKVDEEAIEIQEFENEENADVSLHVEDDENDDANESEEVDDDDDKNVQDGDEEDQEVDVRVSANNYNDQENSDESDKAISSDAEMSDDNQNEDDMEVDNDGNQESEDVIDESPNATHDTTGRNRNKEVTKSPEAILQSKTNQMDSFLTKGRNTSGRRTSIVKNLNVRPSLAPVRESTGFSDGTKDSSAEGSGWDSHRTTRRTIRQTFGKEYTMRKSLRALVMEKSAKRHTEVLEHTTNTTKVPQANSTEFDDHMEPSVEESDHEMSQKTRKTTLETYLQKMKQQNLEKKQKMEEAVRNSLKTNIRDPLNLFKVPTKPAPRRPKPTVTESKKKSKGTILLAELPSELIVDLKYKPPKRFQPTNASWITKRLYKFLESKLEPKYDYKARVRAEKLVETLYSFVKSLRRCDVAPVDAVDVLKHELARLDIVKTHFEFYEFFHEFMPREVRIKVNPDIINKIPLPQHGVFTEILRGNSG